MPPYAGYGGRARGYGNGGCGGGYGGYAGCGAGYNGGGRYESDDMQAYRNGQGCAKTYKCGNNAQKCQRDLEDDYKRKNGIVKHAKADCEQAECNQQLARADQKQVALNDRNCKQKRHYRICKFYQKEWDEDLKNRYDNRLYGKKNCKKAIDAQRKRDNYKDCALKQGDQVCRAKDLRSKNCAQNKATLGAGKRAGYSAAINRSDDEACGYNNGYVRNNAGWGGRGGCYGGGGYDGNYYGGGGGGCGGGYGGGCGGPFSGSFF